MNFTSSTRDVSSLLGHFLGGMEVNLIDIANKELKYTYLLIYLDLRHLINPLVDAGT